MARLPDDIISYLKGERQLPPPPPPPPLDSEQILEVREIAGHMGEDGRGLLENLAAGRVLVAQFPDRKMAQHVTSYCVYPRDDLSSYVEYELTDDGAQEAGRGTTATYSNGEIISDW